MEMRKEVKGLRAGFGVYPGHECSHRPGHLGVEREKPATARQLSLIAGLAGNVLEVRKGWPQGEGLQPQMREVAHRAPIFSLEEETGRKS